MRVIKLTSRENKDWTGKFLDEDCYDLLLDEDALVLKPDGTMLCLMRKKALAVDNLKHAYKAFHKISISTANRGNAAGTGMVRLKKADGTLSNTMVSKETVDSGVIGFMDRNPRYPYCRACAWNLENPEKFAACFPMIQQISKIYEEVDPEHYKLQLEVVKKTSPDFVIPGTVFTTVTINKDFRTACHRDAGNLKECSSVINVIRRGNWKGANLCFPDFKVAAKLDSGDVLFFDPNEFHGNTPLVKLSSDAERWSFVYYYRENIIFCGTAEEELQRVKTRKAGDELKPSDKS